MGDSSGSELSDCEGSDGGPPDRYRASRVRLASLGCLQVTAHASMCYTCKYCTPVERVTLHACLSWPTQSCK